MLKKVHIFNPSDGCACDTSCTEKKCIQCAVCKTLGKSIYYVCESGHVVCKSCQNSDTTVEDSNEGGDYIPEKECGPANDKKELLTNNSGTKTQDLSSGDHDGIYISITGTNNEFTKDSKLDTTSFAKKESNPKTNFETTIKYKNKNYQESKSSATSNCNSFKNTGIKEDKSEIYKIIPRPVVCPVTNCSKMVTIDSIMLHFHFDHSKVPRIILDDSVPQEISLKSGNLLTEIQCIATFLIQTNKSSKIIKKRLESATSLRDSFKENKLLLLMAVRLPTSPIKLPNLKCAASRVFTRSICTQTEKTHGNDLAISTVCLSKNSSDYQSCTSKCLCDEDEVLLLWLCKLDDEEKVYSITLLGEDKKRGYCYIGDAIHIRDKQDPFLLYEKSECLIVKGSAVSNLNDCKNQTTVIVSIIG